MYCCGTDIVLDLIAATYKEERYKNSEISSVILNKETTKQQNTDDIVRLPLKLPFPSLPLKRNKDIKSTIKIVGPDGNVCKI